MSWSRFRRIGTAVLLAAGACLAPGTADAAQVTCADVSVPVRVGLTAQSMNGTLCVPQGATTLQVLVPGGTYNAVYWDIGYDPQVLSYREAVNEAGIATVAVDRLGSGRSSRPLSTLVTLATQAQAVHAVIQSLRPLFRKLVLVGHSIGSAIVMTGRRGPARGTRRSTPLARPSRAHSPSTRPPRVSSRRARPWTPC